MNKAAYTAPELSALLAPVGRTWRTEDGLSFDYSAAGFDLCFHGSSITFITSTAGTESAYIACYLDGVKQKFTLQGITESVLDCPFDGVHTIRFIKISEGNCTVTLTGIRILGQTGTLLDPPAPRRRRIMILGDSITCGYGTDSVSGDDVFRLAEEDVTHSYSYLTVTAFDADYRIAAISGQGIVRDCHGDIGKPIPVFFHSLSRNITVAVDHIAFLPELIIVNAGTNDSCGGVSDSEFRAGVAAFVSELRQLYPEAQILWLFGMMGGRFRDTLSSLVQQMGDGMLHYLDLPDIYTPADPELVGTNGHPTILGQRRCGADIIIPYVSELMRWDTV